MAISLSTGLSSAGAAGQCSFDPASGVLTVSFDAAGGSVAQASSGAIEVSSASAPIPCTGDAATATNTDLVEVTLTASADISVTALGPGRTTVGETGAPEIEMQLAGEQPKQVTLVAAPADDDPVVEAGVERESGVAGVTWNGSTELGKADDLDLLFSRVPVLLTYASPPTGGTFIAGSYFCCKVKHPLFTDYPGATAFAGSNRRDEFRAGLGPATVDSGAGQDFILPGPQNDSIATGGGADDVDTSAGDDSILTGPGVDFIQPGPGDDVVDAGTGSDVVILASDRRKQNNPVEIDLRKTTGQDIGTHGTDSYTAVEGIRADSGVLIGNDQDNELGLYQSGQAQIRGLGGDDQLFVDGNGEGGQVDARVDGGEGDDSVSGGQAADTLVGGPGADVFKGYGGADTLLARDNSEDRRIDCGPGDDEKPKVDPEDPPSRSC